MINILIGIIGKLQRSVVSTLVNPPERRMEKRTSVQCGVEFQKKKLISSCLGTCLVNDYKTNFFPHAHSGLYRPGKQKTAISGQIRSKATMPRHGSRVVEKIFSLPLGTSGKVGLLKLPIK